VDKSGKRAIAFLIGYRSAVRAKEFERLRSKLARVDVRRDQRIFATTACNVRDTPEAGPARWGTSPVRRFASGSAS